MPDSRLRVQVATSLQFSYSEMQEADHHRVGPDAVDVMLWGMTQARNVSEQPREPAGWSQSQAMASWQWALRRWGGAASAI